MKILQLNEKDGLPVQLKWFHHSPPRNKKYIPDEFKKKNYPYYMNYPLIKVENMELQQFKSNQFASSFTQEVSTYAENYNNNHTIFENISLQMILIKMLVKAMNLNHIQCYQHFERND